jgi:hypothetical protein
MFDQMSILITLDGNRNTLLLRNLKNINFSIDEYNWTGIKTN